MVLLLFTRIELFGFVLIFLPNECLGSVRPRVNTPAGDIEGIRRSVTILDGRTLSIDEYLGIPYAQPPVDENRFEKPKPMDKFETVFEAYHYGAPCMQLWTPFLKVNTSEDCLSLNVFVPTLTEDNTLLPVMVFIHGGGFVTGSSNLCPVSTLSVYGGIIGITLNYRLGILGFASTGDKHFRGNYGLWDQQMAIRWVHDNIQAFGGDRERVTLFGQSAGGMSVHHQCMYADNIGLFQNAIAESGSAASTILYTEDKDMILRSAQLLANELKCNTDQSSIQIKKCLKSKSALDIKQALTSLSLNHTTAQILQLNPVLDDSFVKVSPRDFVDGTLSGASEQEKFFAKIRFLTGINSNESGLFLLFLNSYDGVSFGNYHNFTVPRDLIKNTLVPLVVEDKYPSGRPPMMDDLVLAEYTDWHNRHDVEVNRDLYMKLLGDTAFLIPALGMARGHASLKNSAGTWLYIFTAKASQHLLPTAEWLPGANHGDELAFVFGFDPDMKERNSIPNEPEEWEKQLSMDIMTAWTNFAKSGNPNSPGNLKTFSTEWEAFDLGSEHYLEIGRNLAVSKTGLDPRADNFWLNIAVSILDIWNENC